MRDLRVLVVADHFAYSGGVVHGVTRYFLTVLPGLLARNVSVSCCFLRGEHPAAATLRATGVEVQFLAVSKWNPFAYRRIERFARERQINVVHAVGMKSAALGRLLARRLRVGLVIHSHDMQLPPWPLRLCYRLLRVPWERGIAVSRAAAKLMPRAYGTRRDAIVHLFNGIDLEHASDGAAAPSSVLPQGGVIAAWIGRFHTVKAPQRVLRIWQRVLATGVVGMLVMMGDGPDREDCEQLANELGIERRVTFLGQRDDVATLLPKMSALCITSLNEGFPFVTIEAAAAGVPTVAFDVGGLSDAVWNGHSGVLVPDGEEAAFAATLSRVLVNHAYHTELSNGAREWAQHFSLGAHIDGLIAQYQTGLVAIANRKEAPKGMRLLRKASASWRKNSPELLGFVNGALPGFVRGPWPGERIPGIPIYSYHVVEAESFQADLQFLARNGYRCLTLDELQERLSGHHTDTTSSGREVVLTFDDGPRNFHDVAFPLLRRYRFNATVFVAPGLHADDYGEYQSLEQRPMTWGELRTLHESGFVSVQSHTLQSQYVPRWPEPAPLSGVDPRIEAWLRRAPLTLENDFRAARELIEQRLPGARVRHLCYPMYLTTAAGLLAARQAGYVAGYGGLLPSRPLAVPGQSIELLPRMSWEFLRRMPGEGRISLLQLFGARVDDAKRAHARERALGGAL